VQYDVFISHAGEDKQDFVRPLALALRGHRVEVWYDDFTLKAGDRLRREIDRGLNESRYGVVVLSPSFFGKQWPEWELDGLVTLQNSGQEGRILPIWHGVGAADVRRYSPALAGIRAIDTRHGLDAVVEELLRVLHPEGSTLLVARDTAIDIGLLPPVVTDDWWLDVVETSAANDQEGTFQEPMGWGRWGFPLPARSSVPRERGYRLGRAAVQHVWQEAADEQRISQVTHPDRVLEFIETSAGLDDMSWEHPHYLLSYAPQLALPGFAGKFEKLFNQMLDDFLTRRDAGGRRCPEYIALRDIERCGMSPRAIAWHFVHGELHGPSTTCLDDIDVLAWLFSVQSSWVSDVHHAILFEGTLAAPGLLRWPRVHRTWSTSYEDSLDVGAFEDWFSPFPSASPHPRSTEFTAAAERDLECRLTAAAEILGLPETGAELLHRFQEQRIIERHIQAQVENAAVE
jgi:hypothetical protein